VRQSGSLGSRFLLSTFAGKVYFPLCNFHALFTFGWVHSTLNFDILEGPTEWAKHDPEAHVLTKGVGKHKERLTSFELALRDAGIAAQNLVRVSSIFPPNCKMLTRKEGLKYLKPRRGGIRSHRRELYARTSSPAGLQYRCAIPARPQHLRLHERAPLFRARPQMPPGSTPKNLRRKC